MYNSELYKQLEAKYGTEKMKDFSEMLSDMYDILYKDWKSGFSVPPSDRASATELTEYNYERDWWKDAHETVKERIR